MKKFTLLFFLFMLLVLAGCTKGPSPNLCPTVCDGLVAYYPFYGDATDKSGNGQDGKVVGASLTKDRNGYQNHAYSFTGKSNSYISIPKIGIENGSFTIATIVKANRKPIDTDSLETMGNGKWVDSGIIWANGSYTGLRYHFYKQGNQNFWLTLQEQQKPLKQISIHSGVSNPLEYNLFVGIVDKKEKTLSVYVDGEFKRMQSWSGSFFGSNIKSWIIGGRGPASDRYHRGFEGVIDEVRVYNRALSADEVKELYLFTSAFPPAE